MGVNGQTGPVRSELSEFLWIRCLVELDSSGGVDLVCEMKRGMQYPPRCGNADLTPRNANFPSSEESTVWTQ